MRALVIVLFVALATGALGQSAEAPALTDVQRLTVLTTIQRAEIAQLRAEAARRDLDALLKSLQVPNYTLDVNTLTYVPQKPAVPK